MHDLDGRLLGTRDVAEILGCSPCNVFPTGRRDIPESRVETKFAPERIVSPTEQSRDDEGAGA